MKPDLYERPEEQRIFAYKLEQLKRPPDRWLRAPARESRYLYVFCLRLQKRTCEEIGKYLDVTRTRVSQMFQRALKDFKCGGLLNPVTEEVLLKLSDEKTFKVSCEYLLERFDSVIDPVAAECIESYERLEAERKARELEEQQHAWRLRTLKQAREAINLAILFPDLTIAEARKERARAKETRKRY